jgi:riboflavin biosynthesis pyrimidine reductase
VGAATVRAEGYGAPSNPDLRIAVVSRTGAFSPDSALFASGAGVVVVPDTAPPTALPEIRAGRPDDPSSVDLPEVIARLGGRRILVEGGPMLTGQLMAAGLIDTAFVTYAPFAGRGGESLARFGASTGIAPIGFTLRWLYEDGDWLFARYDRIRAV